PVTRRVDPGDADRDALHDLDEVAGGVVGGKQREAGARAAREALDLPLERLAGEGVDLDLHRLAHVHPADLRLFEIGDDVGGGRHQLDERLPHGDELPLVDGQLGGVAVGGGGDLGVA